MTSFIDFLIENYEEPELNIGYLEIPRASFDENDKPIHTDKHKYLSQFLTPSNIKQKDKNTFKRYTESSKQINAHLWNMKLGDVSRVRNDASMRRDTYTMNDILDDFPRHDKPFVVYSGVGNKSKIDQFTGGDGIIHIPSFTSSSLNILEARKFADIGNDGFSHILRIHVAPDHKVGGYIAAFSKFPHEEEYLFKANQLLKIKKPLVYEDSNKTFGRRFKIYDAHFMPYEEYSQHLHNNNHPEIQSYRFFNQKINRGF
ncbi:MAG: hypothetical protein E6R13_06550 [Spirochaetes bacterium]|jgi:hypothetical protein|nr:MAG: hypothetical protein E6R13_06550 [Spirochaetota bacterium]